MCLPEPRKSRDRDHSQPDTAAARTCARQAQALGSTQPHRLDPVMPSIILAQQEVTGRGSWTVLPYRHSKAGEWIWELNRLNLTYICSVGRVFLEVSKTSAYTEIKCQPIWYPFSFTGEVICAICSVSQQVREVIYSFQSNCFVCF